MKKLLANLFYGPWIQAVRDLEEKLAQANLRAEVAEAELDRVQAEMARQAASESAPRDWDSIPAEDAPSWVDDWGAIRDMPNDVRESFGWRN
jgi:hypothetical protein